MQEILSALGLLVLFVLILVCAYYTSRWVGKRYAGQTGGIARNIKVLDRISLGQDRMLFIVEVAGETMLLGVTPQHIEKLCDLNPESMEVSVQENTASFSETFRQVMKNGWGVGGKGGPGPKEGPHE